MNKTLRIFGEDVVFKSHYTTYTASIRYRNRDVVLQFVTSKNNEMIFISNKQFMRTASAEVFEELLPQIIDEVIGVALGVNFCVKRSERSWHYYADIEQPWQIESDPYPNSATPSYEHWRDWIISSIEQRKRDDQNT